LTVRCVLVVPIFCGIDLAFLRNSSTSCCCRGKPYQSTSEFARARGAATATYMSFCFVDKSRLPAADLPINEKGNITISKIYRVVKSD
jgi:hypothetical protein